MKRAPPATQPSPPRRLRWGPASADSVRPINRRGAMTSDDAARDLAERLLSAQVDFIIAEISDGRFIANVAIDTPAVLEVLESVRVADTIDSDEVKDTIRMFFMDMLGSQFAGDMAVAISDAVYDASANEVFRLG